MKRREQSHRMERFLKEKFPTGLPVIDENQFKDLLAEYRNYKLPGEIVMDKIIRGGKNGFFGALEWFFHKFYFTAYFAKSHVMHEFLGKAKHQPATDNAIDQVKEDIEFWYDREMLYMKIMSGSYGNTPYGEDRNWFKNNNIDWKARERKTKLGSKLSTALYSDEFKKLLNVYALISIDDKEKEHALSEIQNFIIKNRQDDVEKIPSE